ncbi:MAG: hypothetical protein U0905_02545 [Pirellulales bacterium]
MLYPVIDPKQNRQLDWLRFRSVRVDAREGKEQIRSHSLFGF